MKVDLHTHSRFFHVAPSRPTPYDRTGLRLQAAAARARGLDAIALTNHDYYADLGVDTGDLRIIPGIEISTTEGHLLVVGPDPPTASKPERMTPEEAVSLARKRDCAAILAHPYRNSRLKETDIGFDAVEVNGKRSQSPEKIEELAAERGLPLVGGSDAHFPFEVGRTYTELEVDELTPEAVVAAIRDGRTTHRSIDSALDKDIRQIYGAIHRLKGHVQETDAVAAREGEPAPPRQGRTERASGDD